MRWLGVLRSRFVLVPLAIAVLVAVWNVYIVFNDDGLVEGEVRDAAGRPLAAATVILFERNFVTHVEKARTQTDGNGRFRFTDNRTHLVQLEAQTGDGKRSERRQVRLWFKAQNVRVAPLVIAAAG
jgi:hypothetical protein